MASVVSGILNGVQGSRLAKLAPDGAVPVETGTEPAPETPPQAVRIQRSLGMLGTLNIASGAALVAVNGMLAQTIHSRPPLRRAALRSGNGNGVSPLTVAAAVGAVGAAGTRRGATSRLLRDWCPGPAEVWGRGAPPLVSIAAQRRATRTARASSFLRRVSRTSVEDLALGYDVADRIKTASRRAVAPSGGDVA